MLIVLFCSFASYKIDLKLWNWHAFGCALESEILKCMASFPLHYPNLLGGRSFRLEENEFLAVQCRVGRIKLARWEINSKKREKNTWELLNIWTVTAPRKLAVTLLGLWPGLGHSLGFSHLAVLQFLILLSKFSFYFLNRQHWPYCIWLFAFTEDISDVPTNWLVCSLCVIWYRHPLPFTERQHTSLFIIIILTDGAHQASPSVHLMGTDFLRYP